MDCSPVRLFGRRRSVHQILGGGFVADVILWRRRDVAIGMLAGTLAAWAMLELSGYTDLSALQRSDDTCVGDRESAKQEVDMMADWSKMLPELLELISDRLPLLDVIAFRGVCRHWRSAPCGRSEVTKFSKDQSWLMLYGIQNSSSRSGTCYLYSHDHSKCCAVYLPELEGATVMESKFGWLIAHRGEHFFLLNFFTLEKICLPEHAAVSTQACTFTTFPTNKDCTVFIVSLGCNSVIELSSCRIHADKSWKVRTLDISKDVVDTMIGVYCCSCSYDHSHCKCNTKNNIGVFGLESSSYYDYVNEKVTDYGQLRELSGKCGTWFDDVRNAHGRDWLARFGEKGISISMCAQSLSFGAFLGRAKWTCIHTASDKREPNVELNSIKGVAIDYQLHRMQTKFGAGWPRLRVWWPF